MESTESSAADGSHHHQPPPQPPPPPQPHLPPGFRFHPTDEELVVHYLKRKAQSAPLPVTIIAEVDLYKFDPWELPAKAVFGEQEWYFFSPRDRKYPNGARPNRAATSGYWKATGTDKPVMTGGNQKVGVKKALVFYGGKPPRGVKTNWIMHEYRLVDNNKPNNKPPGYDNPNNKKGSLRLDDWVLCRIYKKNNSHRLMDDPEREDSMDDMMMMGSMSMSMPSSMNSNMSKSTILNYTSLLDGHGHHHHDGMYHGMSMIDHPMGASSLSHMTPSSTMPLKRTLPSLYWDSNNGDHHDHNNKRLSIIHGSNNNDDDNTININNNIISEESRERNDHHHHHHHHHDHHGNNNNNISSISTLLNQSQSMLGNSPLSDGVFRQPYPIPGFNWFS